MCRLTYKNTDGTWGLKNYDIKQIPRELYGAICKLKDYEQTGHSPEEIAEFDKMYLEKCKEVTELQRQLENLSGNRYDPETKKIKPGDVIECGGERFVILAIDKTMVMGYSLDEEYADLPVQDLSPIRDEMHKTGEHVDLSKIMQVGKE